MMDLTKIDKPFGELDDETAAALFIAMRNGKGIEYYYTAYGEWRIAASKSLSPETKYRLAPETVTPDTIDWSHVAEGWRYMARDESRAVYFYNATAEKDDRQWTTDGDFARADVLASYRRGTCDWKDSLVIRPGTEEAK